MTKRFELDRHVDPVPGLPSESVGPWVLEKHAYLAKYINATYAHRSKWPDRTYIDLFSGPGRVQVRDEGMDRAGGAVLAWEYAKRTGGAFTSVVVNDLDPAKVDACRKRLLALGAPVTHFNGRAADVVGRVVGGISPKSFCLAYIDPYNLEALSFEVIRQLATLKTIDIILHFSIMDMTRNVVMEFDADRARFDDAAPGWRDQINPAHFSKPQLLDAFFAYWCKLVSALGFNVAQRMPLVRNDNNSPLYRLLLLSRHPSADRIWGDVAQGPNREMF